MAETAGTTWRKLRIVAGLDRFWTEITFIDECRRLLLELTTEPGSIEVLAKANAVAGILADIPGDAAAARHHAEET